MINVVTVLNAKSVGGGKVASIGHDCVRPRDWEVMYELS